MTTKYKRHAYSVLFRDADGEEQVIERLMESMSAMGFNKTHPIILVKGRNGEMLVLDGWHRQKAAGALGIEPVYCEREFESDDAMLRFVESENSARKQMNKGQIIAGLLKADSLRPKAERRTEKEIAKMSGASEKSVSRFHGLSEKDFDSISSGASADRIVRKARLKRNNPKVVPLPVGFQVTGKSFSLLSKSIVRHQIGDSPSAYLYKGIQALDILMGVVDVDALMASKGRGQFPAMVREILKSSVYAHDYLREKNGK